ncbi:transmembrane secretion effector [Solirubrobacter pauli]|uniref:Transmembrane secretion effector n=1 Tax=Solirubrobacter pauli TaxID=166793 RepID=A0A660LFX8_9ACTN|nr:MFS transporter [Solirubrobacter pauli]RKQ94037.1 transmembrane secretion effector [Solirubrobacter pauli]
MILPDLGLLRRRRDLRLLVGGSTVSLIGAAFTQVALTIQVFALTDSSIAVGLLGVAQFIPIIALALIGGALADAFDRRKLIFGAELASAFVSAALLVNALLPSPQLWLLYVASTLFAAATAVLRPPLDALLPRLVERDELKAASAISWSLMSISGIVGPALAGLVIAGGGVEAAYAIDVVSFVGSLSAFALMRTPPPPPDAEPPSLRGVIEGVKYAGSRQEILGSYVIDMHAMFFGMPFALFPAVAERYGGTEVVGLLWAAPAVGAIVAMLTSGWSVRVHHNGRAIVFAAAGWGGFVALFGFADVLWLALLALALAGAADAISGIFRGALWNETIPDRLRGRLAGMEMISWSSGPLLGNARAGFGASWLGLGPSIVAGGVVVVAGCFALAAALPKFWNYDSRA